jgi:transposase
MWSAGCDMTAVSAPRPGWDLLVGPGQVNQRRYEALRAYLHDGASHRQAADATGYTRAALASLVRDLRAGKLTLFAPRGVPGRKSARKKEAARGRAIELRRDGLPIYEITRLSREGTPLGRTAVSDILREEGFGRLLRGPEPEAQHRPRHLRPGHPAAGRRPHRLHRPARAHPHHNGRAAALPRWHVRPHRVRPGNPLRR